MKNHKYLIQALSNVDGWKCTKYGGDTYAAAKLEMERIAKLPDLFIGGKVVQMRVIPNPYLKTSLGLPCTCWDISWGPNGAQCFNCGAESESCHTLKHFAQPA